LTAIRNPKPPATPANAQIGALGIRVSTGDVHTSTTLLALAK
jgi:hypothetical protein